MSISVTCPACQAKLKYFEALIGKKVRCKACPFAVIPTVLLFLIQTQATTLTRPSPQHPRREKKAKEKPTTMAAASIDTPDAALVNPKMTTRRKTTASSRKSALDGTRDTAPPPGITCWKKFSSVFLNGPGRQYHQLSVYAQSPFLFRPLPLSLKCWLGYFLSVGIVGGTIMT
ncbi:MAG: hypothetical protein U0936_03340 [Planctomycetaceae bacterium]